MPWISLISFGYIQVDFIVGEWISWISLFRQWISLIRQWIFVTVTGFRGFREFRFLGRPVKLYGNLRNEKTRNASGFGTAFTTYCASVSCIV